MLGIEIAKKYLGFHEIRDNYTLRQLFKSKAVNGDIAIDPAKVSWCAAWINFCERSVGNTGNGHLNAQSFKTYGEDVTDWDSTKEGDIIVFHFPTEPAANGHVTYFVSWDDGANTVKCLGGNQDNEVKYSNYNQDYITAIRRPRL